MSRELLSLVPVLRVLQQLGLPVLELGDVESSGGSPQWPQGLLVERAGRLEVVDLDVSIVVGSLLLLEIERPETVYDGPLGRRWLRLISAHFRVSGTTLGVDDDHDRGAMSPARDIVVSSEEVYSHSQRAQWSKKRRFGSQGQNKPGGESRGKAAELCVAVDGMWDAGMTRGKL